MTEVYSVIEQKTEPGTIFMLAIFVAVGVGLLTFFIIQTIRMITSKKVSVIGIIMGVGAIAFGVFWLYILISGVWSTDKTYTEYMKAWESGSYSVESGVPEELNVYKPPRSNYDDGCTVSFKLNGKYFDTWYAFGADTISESEWAMIKNSKAFEVKYITDDEGNNVIFSLSVEAPDTATDERSNVKENSYD